jgi:predicted ribosomally synthesized peptide with SipW-like signal peptide
VRKFIFALLATLLALGVMGGTFAYFQDTETSTTNSFTAGTLDLQVVSPYGGEPFGGFAPTIYNGEDIQGISLDCMVPGGPPIGWRMHVNNLGCIDGILYIHFTVTSDLENTLEEPEVDLGDDSSSGEMDDCIVVDIYYGDESAWPSPAFITSGTLSSLHCNKILLGALNGELNPASLDGKDVYLVFQLPPETTDICQSDTVTFSIDLILDQIGIP